MTLDIKIIDRLVEVLLTEASNIAIRHIVRVH